MSEIAGRDRCRLEDVQACHIDALDALRIAIERMRRQARTAEDLRILRELYTAQFHLDHAWCIVTRIHPQGVNHEPSELPLDT